MCTVRQVSHWAMCLRELSSLAGFLVYFKCECSQNEMAPTEGPWVVLAEFSKCFLPLGNLAQITILQGDARSTKLSSGRVHYVYMNIRLANVLVTVFSSEPLNSPESVHKTLKMNTYLTVLFFLVSKFPSKEITIVLNYEIWIQNILLSDSVFTKSDLHRFPSLPLRKALLINPQPHYAAVNV